MLAERFDPFTFSPAGAAVYQLGPFGTAAKKLEEWDCWYILTTCSRPNGHFLPPCQVAQDIEGCTTY